MDINKIFNLFNSKDEESDKSNMELPEGPIVWIGMFKKLIINYETFTKQLIVFLNTSDPSLDAKELDKVSKFLIYERAYNNICQLDLNNQMHLDCLKLYSDEVFAGTLSLALTYYVDLEEYEKCAVIKQIQDTINSFQK
jgi:hypothetical protein